jgi:ferredoxin-NADP reductase
MARLIVEMPVVSVKLELPDVKTVRLQWPEGYDVSFKTGQFITVYWSEKPEYKRAYSLSSAAVDRGFYEFTVKRAGKMGTRVVDWAEVGDRLFVIPPTGRFLPVYEPDVHLLCIAGGSGVTPFRAFVREAIALGHKTRITVLYSVRNTGEIIFHDEFRQLESQYPNFRFLVTCTRLEANDPWNGRRGRIDGTWLRAHVDDAARTMFYACGPNALVECAEHLVTGELGLPKSQMRTEKWG